MERLDSFFYKLRYLTAGLVIIAGLLLIALLFAGSIKTQSQTSEGYVGVMVAHTEEHPTIFTSGLAKAGHGVSQTMNSLGKSINQGITSTAAAAARSGKLVSRAAHEGKTSLTRTASSGIVAASNSITATSQAVERSVSDSIKFTSDTIDNSTTLMGRVVKGSTMSLGNIGQISGDVVSNSLDFTGRLPGKIVGLAPSPPAVNVSGLIRPADHTPVPIIDPDSPELRAARAALPADSPPSPSTPAPAPAAQWPIHGKLTTRFGVAHWPYQPVHTGLDISSGRPSGVTPVKPFRPGQVTKAERSARGLGNHVVIDHGNGVTSVYGHLASIAVQPGQAVDNATTLGYEGTTGVSTGTHLHFEIRVNGQAADPYQFISGQP